MRMKTIEEIGQELAEWFVVEQQIGQLDERFEVAEEDIRYSAEEFAGRIVAKVLDLVQDRDTQHEVAELLEDWIDMETFGDRKRNREALVIAHNRLTLTRRIL